VGLAPAVHHDKLPDVAMATCCCLQSCAAERKMFCGEVAPGGARVFRCLAENLADADFGENCRGEIIRKLQRRCGLLLCGSIISIQLCLASVYAAMLPCPPLAGNLASWSCRASHVLPVNDLTHPAKYTIGCQTCCITATLKQLWVLTKAYSVGSYRKILVRGPQFLLVVFGAKCLGRRPANPHSFHVSVVVGSSQTTS
jgi:hypothetical protein